VNVDTDPKFIPDLCIWLEFSIVRATAMTPYKSSMLVFDRVSRAISGSTTDHICASAAIEAMEVRRGVRYGGTGDDIDADVELPVITVRMVRPTHIVTYGSLNITGKSKRVSRCTRIDALISRFLPVSTPSS